MNKALNFIDGYKTKIGGGGLFLVAVAEIFGNDVVPSINADNAIEYAFAGLMIIFGRDALKKLEKTKNDD